MKSYTLVVGIVLLCVSTVQSRTVDTADPKCDEGVLSDDHSVCCPTECGSCGGHDCNARPGGRDSCCELAIQKSGRSCEANSAPCTMDAPAPPSGLRFANSYGDHMVLQESPARAVVWGYCGPQGCDDVRVSLDGVSNVLASPGGEAGTWIAKLPATDGGSKAHTVIVSDGNQTVTLTDVLFGDVWVCSGS